ncbi:prepilin-type N-terminal cleavage/methylation domain-containing protein [Rhodoferax sp. GW822-FHT02A01]|uniref:type II secretion system protein n=1 Tax=Rhodoferax sp. GW822-FHT02A01 TaxID=3141537 RepID=UPI00315C6F6B
MRGGKWIVGVGANAERLQWARVSISRGFTLIELLVVMAVLAILASLVAPRFMDRVDTAREVVLRQNLVGLRTAIDQFYRDQSRYPESLSELVDKRYIRAIPEDPVTQRTDTWVLVQSRDAQGSSPSTGAPATNGSNGSSGIYDVHSGASGHARDGSDYAQW